MAISTENKPSDVLTGNKIKDVSTDNKPVVSTNKKPAAVSTGKTPAGVSAAGKTITSTANKKAGVSAAIKPEQAPKESKPAEAMTAGKPADVPKESKPAEAMTAGKPADVPAKNKILVRRLNGTVEEVPDIAGIKITFEGKGATVELDEPFPRYTNCRFELGNNASIRIGKSNRYIEGLSIKATQTNSRVKIGDFFSCFATDITLRDEPDLSVEIGNECIFASNIKIRTSDAHAIIDLKTSNAINCGKSVYVGNRVWVALDCTVLKGSVIPDNCVVGLGSIVNKAFEETNCVIAGVPACITKRDIIWDYRSPDSFQNPVLDYSVLTTKIEVCENLRSYNTIETAFFSNNEVIKESSNVWNAKVVAENLKPNAFYRLYIKEAKIIKGNPRFYQVVIKDKVANSPCYIKNQVFGAQLDLYFKTDDNANNLEIKVYCGEAGRSSGNSIELVEIGLYVLVPFNRAVPSNG